MEEEAEFAQMMAVVTKYGYMCQPEETLIKEVAVAISSKMIQCSGDHIYQMATFMS